ncbi:MAG: M50 family metallopeptidase [Sarcina sp.]
MFAILAFSLIIFVHELGHFIAAKINGVNVTEFAIGMGPQLFSIKKGGTAYSIRILPIGGFVQMYGEVEQEGIEIDKNDKTALANKSPFVRFIVFFAGAFMNFILAIIIFAAVTMNFGYKTTEVIDVENGSPAALAGIENGDVLTKLNKKKLQTLDDLRLGLAMAKDEDVTIEYKRGNEILNATVKPMKTSEGSYIIGVTNKVIEKPGIIESFKQGYKELVGMVGTTLESFKMLITGKVNFKTDVGGPVTIIRMAGTAAKTSIWSLLNLTAFLSVQIGVFNLLPIPALDGGHIITVLIEGITRKKIPTTILNMINTVGFILLLGLMAIVVLKDILFPIVL